MGTKKIQPWSGDVWRLARRQRWVVTRAQLMELGMSSEAIRHRLRSGRLRRVMRGVYAVDRREIDSRGRWLAAVLACGSHALLSHHSAAALLGIREERPGPIDVVVPDHVARRHPGIRVHRRAGLLSPGEWSKRWPASETVDQIPVTGPVTILVDLAAVAAGADHDREVGCLSIAELEAAVNEASQRDLVDPESLREALDAIPPRPGVPRLRRLLDRHTFVLTTTRLEQLFVPLARAAGLPLPQTQVWLGRHRVDFFWPDLGLVVEADSLRYHRTPAKQAADNRRDQDHIAAGRMPLRFAHWQIRYEPDHVRKMLEIAARQREGRG